MLALIKHPGSPTARFELPDDERRQLQAMQEGVGGLIEIAVRLRDAVVWCDEEGKIKADRKRVNFHRPTDCDSIVGTIIVTNTQPSIDGEVFAPLTEAQADRIAKLLDRWALRGMTVGGAVEDWDPEDEHEAEVIRNRLARGEIG